MTINRFTVGTYRTQGKKLPGAYSNVRSGPSASSKSERGIVAVAMSLDWFNDNDIVELTREDFYSNYKVLFARNINDPELLGLREIFINANTVLIYRLNSAGTKATATSGKFTVTAKNVGTRGNDISFRVAKSTHVGKYDVSVYLDGKMIDYQTVVSIKDLITSRFVDYGGVGDFEDTDLTANTGLSGGTNGEVTTENHTDFLEKLEKKDFNILVCGSADNDIKELYASYTKRLRDEKGLPFQTVIHGKLSDHIGIIGLKNSVVGGNEIDLVYYHAGVEASVSINSDLANHEYKGELEIEADYSDELLELYLEQGWAVYNRSNSYPYLIEDINSFTSFTEDMKKDFAQNQVVRTTDYVIKNIKRIWNIEFLGKVNNTDANREGFRGRVLKFLEEMQNQGAIVELENEDFMVKQGNSKDSVVAILNIQPAQSMKKLYLEVLVY